MMSMKHYLRHSKELGKVLESWLMMVDAARRILHWIVDATVAADFEPASKTDLVLKMFAMVPPAVVASAIAADFEPASKNDLVQQMIAMLTMMAD